MPLNTDSDNLVITGHHYINTKVIWRDPPKGITRYNRPDGGTTVVHKPIDPIHFYEFPEGAVKTITFSACNTAKKPISPKKSKNYGFDAPTKILMDRYSDSLKTIQGWDGTAPYKENLRNIISAEGNIPDDKYVYTKDGKVKGTRSWMIKRGTQWFWTQDGKEWKNKYGNKFVLNDMGEIVKVVS